MLSHHIHPTASITSHDELVDHLSDSLVTKLRDRCQDDAVDLSAILLTAYAVVLARFTGQTTIRLVVGAPSMQVGICPAMLEASTVLVTTDIDLTDAPPFMTVVQRVQKDLFHVIAPHDRHAVMFTYHHVLEDGATPDAYHPHSEENLSLTIAATGNRVQTTWISHGRWLEVMPMAQLHGHFQTLLAGIVVDMVWPVSHLPLLTPVEQQLLVAEWNATAAPYPDTHCIHWLFEEQVLRQPHAPALVFGGNILSYHELNTRANQLAHYLQRRSVGPETLVGICIDRSLDMIVAALGVLKAGGAYVPLDPAYPAERLAFMVGDAKLSVLLTRQVDDSTHLLIDLDALIAANGDAPTVVDLHRDWSQIAHEPDTNPVSAATADNLAYVIYTSGSTGQPKGVLLQHRGLVNLVTGLIPAFDITSESRVLQFASLSFDGAVCEIFTTLVAGATLYLARRETLISPPDLLNFLRVQAITTAALPPSLLAMIPNEDVPTLRTIVSAGESCSWEVALRWAVGRRFVNAYGPTEVTVGPTYYVLGEQATNSQTVPIGRPLPNYQVYILDQHQQPVPVGFPGELYIGGVGLARGYLNRPELTAERFIEWSTTDLDAPAATFTSSHTTIRLYKTGDLARYLRDGNIEFLGRIDHQVKLRGFRIELGEIESVLRRHPAVQDAVVLVREDTPGDPRLVAYITGKAMVIDTVELHDYLQHQLASYMIPSAFVRLQALPLTVNGKVDRRALPMPTADNPAPPATALPRTSEEATLAQIWALVLGRSSVGIYDDFFALGGHSLLAARALALVNERLDRSVSLQVLFECPTVAAFAQALGREAVAATEKAPADLAADVVLGQAINLQVPVSPLTASATAILLTGATGYLGAFLLHELLIQTETTIHCLVRAADDTEAHQRIEEALSRYGIWHESWRSRIVPVVGDLASAQLGLSREAFRRLAVTIDVVYHVGAQVHYLHPYGTLKQANVQGTVEILRLACQERSKPIHYISTLAVVASSRERVYEDDDLPACTSPLGYVQSKWVAEGIIHLARARGVPVSVYRPGRIGCHSQRRIANSDDFFMRLLTACIELGLAPDVPMLENLIPVDYTARAIVHLSQQPALVNTTFHLINPKPTRWSWVVETARHLGYPLRLVPYGEWRSALSTAVSSERGDALHGLLLLTPEDPSAANWIDSWTKQAFDIQNTITGLVGSGLHCPDFDAPMLERMLAAAVRHGLLDAPAQSDHTFEEADTLVP